jgi:hypothetical protein
VKFRKKLWHRNEIKNGLKLFLHLGPGLKDFLQQHILLYRNKLECLPLLVTAGTTGPYQSGGPKGLNSNGWLPGLPKYIRLG